MILTNAKSELKIFLFIFQDIRIVLQKLNFSRVRYVGGRNFASGACHRRQYNSKLDDNVTNVFGAKFLRALSPINICLPEEGAEEPEEPEKAEEPEEQDGRGHGDDPKPSSGLKAKNAERKIWGMVSKAGEGVGRADNDRQFFYLNGRPVDLPKVCTRIPYGDTLRGLFSAITFCFARATFMLRFFAATYPTTGWPFQMCFVRTYFSKPGYCRYILSCLRVVPDFPHRESRRVFDVLSGACIFLRILLLVVAVHTIHQRGVARVRNEAKAGVHPRPEATPRDLRRQRHS